MSVPASENSPILHVDDDTFERDVMGARGALVLDFWAPWCAPCRRLGAALERLAPEFAGRVRVAKIDVDRNPRTAARFGVQSIPTMVFFADGRPIGGATGALPESTLRDLFSRHAEGKLASGRDERPFGE